MARGGESQRHWRLKQAALAWAGTERYPVRACEIRLPHSSYRADVVAYRPCRPVSGAGAAIGQTAVFECKQSRPDFLKDARSAGPILERLSQLRQRLERLETLLGVHYPSLRCGDSLFPEYERVACERLNHRTWQRVTREIRILENRLHGKTKFEKLVRYRCANLLYLVTVNGVFQPHEIPAAWGVLTCEEVDPGEEGPPPALCLVRKPQFLEAEEAARLDLIQRIASSATRRVNVQLGLEAPAGGEGSVLSPSTGHHSGG